MVYKFFDKKFSGNGVYAEPNYQLANELHRQIIREFQRQKFYSLFRDKVWGVDLADMQSPSKYNGGIKCLLCAIDLFSKYAWVVPLKDKRERYGFRKIISKVRKPNKLWGDQGGEFYNKLFNRFLKINNIEMYSTCNEGKSVVVKRFIRAVKNKIFKHIMLIFDVLDNIINKYNNTVHKTIKVKPIDVTSDSYAVYNEDSNVTKPKSKVGFHVRISKYKNIFAKGYTQNWSEEVFIVSKIKDTVSWTYVISDLNGEPITGSFYEKELQKTSQKKFIIGKVIKRKDDKLFVKWKGYNNSFNSWTDKKVPHIKMSQYFPKPFRSFGGNLNVKIGLSNYATKTDLKNATHVDTSRFALKPNLASLNTEIDKLDIDELAPVPLDLSKLSKK